MLLNSIKSAFGAKKGRTRVGRGIGSGLGKLAEEVIKVKSLDLEVFTKLDLRADKCRFKGASLKEVLMH